MSSAQHHCLQAGSVHCVNDDGRAARLIDQPFQLVQRADVSSRIVLTINSKAVRNEQNRLATRKLLKTSHYITDGAESATANRSSRNSFSSLSAATIPSLCCEMSSIDAKAPMPDLPPENHLTLSMAAKSWRLSELNC